MRQRLYTIMISMIMLAGAIQSLGAQNKPEEGWKEKMMSEKIGFITMELNITPEEAQAFWPVYNKVDKDRDEARHELMKAHKAMTEAIEAGKPTKEISAALENYLSAKVRLDEIDNGSAQKFKNVLPIEKVAKLYVAEEKFRRQYIHKLHHKKDGEK